MLSVKKKCVPLQSQSGNKTIADIKLGYGVMVTLQILVLSFLVRVRVPQLLLTTVLQRVKQSFCFYLKKGFRQHLGSHTDTGLPVFKNPTIHT